MRGALATGLLAALLLRPVCADDETPANLSKKAGELIQQGRAPAAIIELKRIVRKWPRYFPAYSLMGVAYSQLGKLHEAQPYFQKAVELAPQSLEARNNLGVNYLALKKPLEAARQFERVIAADPANVTAWVNLANSWLRIRDVPKALHALERAQSLAPRDLEVQLALADARFQTGEAEAALEQVRQLGRSASDPRILLALGLLLERNEHSQEAPTYLQQAGQADPDAFMALAEKSLNEGDYRVALALLNAVSGRFQNNAAWHAMAGYAHFKLDQPAPALENLQQAVGLDPSNEDHYLELSEFLGANNAVDTVVTVLESAAKALPGSIKIETALGLAYLMIADTGKAEAIFKNVVKSQPGYEIAYKLLADCYLREHDWDALKSVAEVLRERDPKNAVGWYYGALAEYEMLDSGGGAASLEKIRRYTRTAIRLDPDDWRSQVLAGKLALREKHSAGALAAFHKATDLNPAEPSAYYLLATTLRDLGRTDESKAAFEAFRRVQSEEKARKFRTLVIEILKR